MKPKFLSVFAALTFLLSACGSNAPAAPSNSNGQNPIAAPSSATETQPVIPTDTAVPPTLEPSPTLPVPTNTIEASPTLAPTEVPPTFTAVPASSSKTDCNHPLLSWTVPTSTLTVYDETKSGAQKIIVLVSVFTNKGECGWLKVFDNTFTGPVGMYSVTAFVEGKKNFTVSGNFQIQEGAWKVVIRNNTVIALGGCYPNC